MLGTVLWWVGAYGFYRYVMRQCAKAAREGYQLAAQELRQQD